MGKLNIAHHKSYHPYRRDNIERVRRDEEVLVVCSAAFSSDFPSGLPVAFASREVLRVNAASRSSRRTMQRAGTRPISVVSVLSLIHEDDNDTTYMSSINSPAMAWMSELFPEPGTP